MHFLENTIFKFFSGFGNSKALYCAVCPLLSSHNVYCFYLQYEGSIEENTAGVEVMRIKAQDLDLEHTENWDAVFKIVQGNEAGYFSIKTDPKTNEGILMLDKVLLNEQYCSVAAYSYS